MALSPAELARYRRHLTLGEIGLAGQEKLKAARVLVIGAGGLGSPSALYLAASGIGTLGLVDDDRVDASNLQRQVLFDTQDLGQLKAETARERLRALNPEISVIAHVVNLRAGNIRDVMRDYDIVLDGTDRLATRYLINDACVMAGKPLITAAIHRFEGQAMTYVPDRGPCYRCLFAEADDSVVPSCAEAGVLGVLPGVMGAIQATEAIKLVTGIGEPLIGRLLTYDALEMRFHELRFDRNESCAVCGRHPTITELRDPPELCSAEALASVLRLTPVGLRAALDERPEAGAASAWQAEIDGPLELVDVREPREFQAGHLSGAVNIPLGELRHRLREIPPHVTPVFVCRSGTRSLTACGIALDAGIPAPAHLEGGLLAWAAEVDESLQVAAPG